MFTTTSKTQQLIRVSLFAAIIFILTFTPIGLIDLPVIKATIIHVPVIIGAILLGPKSGAVLGFLFGLASLIKNTMVPSLLSFAFSPLIPVPGMDRGSFWALVVCFIPRILVGVLPYYVYVFLQKLTNEKGKTPCLAVAGVFGAATNTGLVMPLMYLVFRDGLAVARNVDTGAVAGVVMGIIVANGVPEAIAAGVLTMVICRGLMLIGKQRSTVAATPTNT